MKAIADDYHHPATGRGLLYQRNCRRSAACDGTRQSGLAGRGTVEKLAAVRIDVHAHAAGGHRRRGNYGVTGHGCPGADGDPDPGAG
jgi:hypothetical protein